jgi:hypothetical protein
MFKTEEDVVYGLFQLVLSGQNLRFGEAEATAAAVVAVCNQVMPVGLEHMLEEQFA